MNWQLVSSEDGVAEEKEPLKGSVLQVEEKRLTVEQINNHIYFYATVDSDRCLALIRAVREVDQMLRTERATRDLPDEFPHTPIWLHIYSGGGLLFAGLSVADQLKAIRSPIHSVVEGYCASAATLISMACTQRFITPSSFLLIHQLSGMAWGTYAQLQDEMHLLDMAMERLTTFYVDHSNLEASDVEGYLKRDSWFNAEQCIELGFVDEIYRR